MFIEYTQIASGMKQIRLGDLRPTRDFNFVKETCRGFSAIAECDDTIVKEINICSNFEISMSDALNIIKKIMKSKVEFLSDDSRLRPDTSEVFRLWGNDTLIKILTDFEPEFTLEKGLRITIDWFTKPENLKKYKANIYNL
jgi:nucleoside-diphosphate-sugar epimerase